MKNPLVFWGSLALGITFVIIGIGYITIGAGLLPLALEAFR